MAGMVAALSIASGLAGRELGEYRVGYISQDGMRHPALTGRLLAPPLNSGASQRDAAARAWRSQPR
jgi:hypothetical protein